MKNPILTFMIASAFLVTALACQAQTPEAQIVAITNPAQSIGIHIGDVLQRKVELVLNAPYQLSKSAYPAKGLSREGIELVDIAIETKQHDTRTHYTLTLNYQVFASARMPGAMQLPAEKLLLSGGPKALVANIPAWRFWYSPLVNGDIHTAKSSMQPQHSNEIVDVSAHQNRRILYLGTMLMGVLGLLYFNADRPWLPYMGGAFSRAYRQLKRLSGKADADRQALLHLHQAFNQTHGSNLFVADLDQFLDRHPRYSQLKLEIEAFFERSNQTLFAAQPQENTAFLRELTLFCKSLRDCERGA
jgi:mxaA protein